MIKCGDFMLNIALYFSRPVECIKNPFTLLQNNQRSTIRETAKMHRNIQMKCEKFPFYQFGFIVAFMREK